jgi:hypothetical protein
MKAKMEAASNDEDENDFENNDLNFAEFIQRADLRNSDSDKHNNPK